MDFPAAMRPRLISPRRLCTWHWTAHATLVIALITAVAILQLAVAVFSDGRFVRAIEEAGGAVHFDARHHSAAGYWLGRGRPVAVEIASGSHPIPPELAWLSGMPSVKSLSLNTSQVTDRLVPVLATFRHLERLDLSGTSLFFSGEGVKTLLAAMPGLKELHIDAGLLRDEEIRALSGGYKLRIRGGIF